MGELLDHARGHREAKLRAEVARLRKIVDAQSQQIEESRQAKRMRLPKPLKGRKGKAFIRAIIPDTHGMMADRQAVSGMLSDLADLQPAEVVMLGDHLECGGFLAQHQTMGFVAQTSYSYAEDIAAAETLLDAIRNASPAAEIHYLEGNHEDRVERWCVTTTLRHQQDCELLRRSFAPQFVLHLEERGIKYYRRSERYHGLAIPGAIQLGRCYFVHGISTAKHAASVHLAKFGACVVYGHTHRADGVGGWKVDADNIAAWSPGCLCEKQPLWMHSNPTDWTHGYAVQIVESNGDFLHLNIPIASGRSLLRPLIGLFDK